MKRIFSFLAVAMLLFTAVSAQTFNLDELNDIDLGVSEESSVASDISEDKPAETDFVYKPNQKGDQFVRLNLALEAPVQPEQLKFGGTGTLSYGMFVTDSINLSGKMSFAYTTTIGGNIFYFIPFTICAQYQLLYGNFEVPLSIEIGGALQSYIDRLYFGFVAKPEAGLFYRISPDWSVGAYAGMYIMPQWYSDPEYNYTGYISDIGLGVRYHF